MREGHATSTGPPFTPKSTTVSNDNNRFVKHNRSYARFLCASYTLNYGC